MAASIRVTMAVLFVCVWNSAKKEIVKKTGIILTIHL